MKSRLLLVCSFVLMTLFGASFASAQSNTDCPVVTLFNMWAPSSPAGAPNGVIYGLLTNLSNQPDKLVSATTDVAEAVEFHQTIMGAGDVMQMQSVEGGIPVATQSYQELKSGGLHIMLVNLTQALVAGQSFNLTLTFEHANSMTIQVPVRDTDQATSTMGDMSSGMTMDSAGMSGDMGSMSMGAASVPTATAVVWPAACAGMHVVGAWVRAAGPGMPTSAAYALLVNLTGADDTLLSVTTSAASSTELHDMTVTAGDVMQMNPVEGGILIPADGAVMLQPGGKHVMLMGLTQELTSGTMIDLTLTFAHSGKLNITTPVQDASVADMSMDGTAQGNGG